jgi:hypothetical protein
MHGPGVEVVEGSDTVDDRAEGGGNLRIAGVGDVHLAVDFVIVDFRVEGGFNLARGSGEVNEHVVGVDDIDGEAFGLKPVANGFHVRLGGSETLTELLGADPLVVAGGLGVVHVVDELGELGIELSRTLEDQHHVIELQFRRNQAAVVLGDGFGAGIACEGCENVVVNSSGNELALGFRLGGKHGAESQSSHRQNEAS